MQTNYARRQWRLWARQVCRPMGLGDSGNAGLRHPCNCGHKATNEGLSTTRSATRICDGKRRRDFIFLSRDTHSPPRDARSIEVGPAQATERIGARKRPCLTAPHHSAAEGFAEVGVVETAVFCGTRVGRIAQVLRMRLVVSSCPKCTRGLGALPPFAVLCVQIPCVPHVCTRIALELVFCVLRNRTVAGRVLPRLVACRKLSKRALLP